MTPSSVRPPSSARRPASDRPHASARNLITGGAGFIGSNLAYRLLQEGERVTLLDNLSRPNVERNVTWLKQAFGERVQLECGDVRDEGLLRRLVGNVDHVFHFAAQVAVTGSLEQPLLDFDVNARATLLLLEALRACAHPPALFFTSTNKVYGSLPWLELRAGPSSYGPAPQDLRTHGLAEAAPLDFHSPYGCSKGCADQYVRDYTRSFGLRCVVFRMSCIYGPRQFGTEDQGWVAHFLLRALQRSPATIYGDGRQVRDLLFVGDLVDAFLSARQALDECSGEAFNIGGGPENAVSVLQLLEQIGELLGERPPLQFGDWRTGDQRYYVSDTRKFSGVTGWRAKVPVRAGLGELADWLRRFLASRADSGLQFREQLVEGDGRRSTSSASDLRRGALP